MAESHSGQEERTRDLRLFPDGTVVARAGWTLVGSVDGDGTFVPTPELRRQHDLGMPLYVGWASQLAELGARRGPWVDQLPAPRGHSTGKGAVAS